MQKVIFADIKERIERELQQYSENLDESYGLKGLSPLLSDKIKDFISREGKRIRPVLFCIGYLGFAEKIAEGLYKSALSFELLHDFMLIHDDVIDKSDTRRGKPSMHVMLEREIPKRKHIKFNGNDMAIVLGDVMYAMALDAFLEIEEEKNRKERALRKLIFSALFTGSGEFMELLLVAEQIEKVTRDDIYKVYDHKTANYTFSSPLAVGATLAGAKKEQIEQLVNYGMSLGRAFQIKDDIMGVFGSSSETGKSAFTDIKEAKKTILVWHAFNHSGEKDKKRIQEIFSKTSPTLSDLRAMREIIVRSGSLKYAKKEVRIFKRRAECILGNVGMRSEYSEALKSFSAKTVSI